MSPAMTDDAADVEAVLAARGDGGLSPGAEAAFTRIYQRHAPVVRALCRTRCAVEAAVDDALQETFIRAYRLLEQTRGSAGSRSGYYKLLARARERLSGLLEAFRTEAA